MKLKFNAHFFYRRQMNSGVVLIIAAIAAVVCANTPGLSEWYHEFLETPITLGFGDYSLHFHGEAMTLSDFISDFLMTIFFFMVGLEIKREILVGELSSVRKALLPIIAACGGMIVPVIIFRLMSPDAPEALGSAIPMATDIAFAIGVLSLLGDRVPLSLKIFLTAFAVVDDIGGIIVIALFYSHGVAWDLLMYSGGLMLILAIGNYKHISSKLFYLGIGMVIWFLFLESGIHCTISGVIVAFFVPARPRWDVGRFVKLIAQQVNHLPMMKPLVNGESVVLTNQQIAILRHIESASDRVISPLQDLEDTLNPFVNYIIMPLFAFANAGVSLQGISLDVFTEGVAVSAFLGLVVGKFIGIYLFTWAIIKMKVVPKPTGMTWKNLVGIAMLGGIGFTVSLFIANLSYVSIPDVGITLLNNAKIGILCGSVVSGILGYLYLNKILPKKEYFKRKG